MARLAPTRYNTLCDEEVNVRGTMHVLDLARRYAVWKVDYRLDIIGVWCFADPLEESQPADRPLFP
jgi:hypothetical protein